VHVFNIVAPASQTNSTLLFAPVNKIHVEQRWTKSLMAIKSAGCMAKHIHAQRLIQQR